MPGSVPVDLANDGAGDIARTQCLGPVAYTGSLDSFVHHDVTPAIGREYEGLQVATVLGAEHSDVLIRDLAVTGILIQTTS